MANAVLVEGITATVGNAVLIQSLSATSAANAVLVHAATAATVGAAPVANAGTGQTVEPWSAVTLTGATSTDDGTIVSYAWTQTAGPAVSLAGTGATRTFTAPPTAGGSSHTFSLTVTDNAGLVSVAPATVTVTVLPVTEFARVGGAWQPRRPRKRSGSAWV